MSGEDKVNSLAKRLLAHLDSKTTDQAADVYYNPVSRYFDPARWRAEIDTIFKRLPLVLATTAELRQPGEYRALTVAEIPIVIVRQNDGTVRGFLNACRHRGAPLAEEGAGSVRRFVCPYHGWAYERSGALAGIAAEDTFGEVDKPCLSLTEIPVAERVGLVFGIPTVSASFDIDEWLGGFADELAELHLEDRFFFTRSEMDGANWKLLYDGYLESYHFAALHTKSVYETSHTNLMAADVYGPHQRIAYARRTITEISDLPTDQWDAAKHMALVQAVFPNTAIAGTYDSDYTLVSMIFPGISPRHSRTVQTVLSRDPLDTPERLASAQKFSDFFHRIVSEEDYWINDRIQRGFESGANSTLVFGRNELTLHHFHSWVDRIVDAPDPST